MKYRVSLKDNPICEIVEADSFHRQTEPPIWVFWKRIPPPQEGAEASREQVAVFEAEAVVSVVVQPD